MEKPLRNYFLLIFPMIFLLFNNGCQTVKEYHDDLIETSLVSEIPTLLGNCAGSVVGTPFLLVSTPIAYLHEDDQEKLQALEKENQSFYSPNLTRNEIILWPMKVTSHTFGILLGTPFYWPWAKEFLPRDRPEKAKKTVSSDVKKNS